MNDTILKTVSELRQQLDEKVADIKSDERMEDILKIHKTIVTLEELAEVPVTALGRRLFGFTESDSRRSALTSFMDSAAAGGGEALSLRSGAAPAHLDEIAKGIRSGGCQDFKEDDLGEVPIKEHVGDREGGR